MDWTAKCSSYYTSDDRASWWASITTIIGLTNWRELNKTQKDASFGKRLCFAWREANVVIRKTRGRFICLAELACLQRYKNFFVFWKILKTPLLWWNFYTYLKNKCKFITRIDAKFKLFQEDKGTVHLSCLSLLAAIQKFFCFLKNS